jgi:chromosome partitioning protein
MAEREEIDRAARGRRIFEALRRNVSDPTEQANGGATSDQTVAVPTATAPAASAETPPQPEAGEATKEAVTPATAPAPETPIAEPPETPIAETPIAEPPETPIAETPIAETPIAETPIAEPPIAETPIAETPEPPIAETPETPEPPARDEEPPGGAVLPDADALGEELSAPAPVPAPAPVAATPNPPVEAPDEADVRGAETARESQPEVEGEFLRSTDLPRVIAIANQKGGVGKTTTSVNLGASLAELGFRVLVVDLDPQGNATTGLGIDIRNLASTVYDALMAGGALEDCIEATSVRNLFVAPSNMDLAGAEIELVPMFSRELKLRRAIELIKDDYDYILIDCPPSLGLLTVNGLAAADDVIVPIQCEYYALEGLGQLVNNVQLVRSNLNPVLDIRGIILTMYDARTKLADQVVDEVRGHFGTRVYRTVVPRTVRLSEAPSFGQPIIVYDPSSRGAAAYRELAQELSGGPKVKVEA